MGKPAQARTPDTQLFRDAFNASPVGIVVETLEGQPLFVNPAFCAFLGFTEEEMQGKHCVDFSPPEDAERDWALFQQLRAGSIDHYQLEKRYFRRDGSLVWGHLSLSLLHRRPSPLVIAMVVDITEKKVREELLKIFVQNVPAGVAMLDRDMRYLQVSDRWCADYGRDRSQLLGRSHYEVFPDIPSRWKDVHCRALRGETFQADEDRWDRENGRTTWVRWEVRPWHSANGSPEGILIFAEDITRRKQMEEALSGVSRKLIESQEQDRTRIGRDLHDDINQKLALLAIDIEQLREHTPDSVSETRAGLAKIKDRIHALGADVQSLSHQLHSPQLQFLGIVAAIRGFCTEFAVRQNVKVDFTHDNIPKGVPHEVSLCLFRVLQEALHNAAKHSNVRQYEVRLGRSASEIHLTISDRGTGFNADAAIRSGGLGLVSMRERVRLVNGAIVIKSTPNGGTIIDVRVPVIFETYLQQSAG